MSGGRLPKQSESCSETSRVQCGEDRKEKEWTDCVQSDIRAFGITVDWKARSLKAEVWVETDTEGGQRFMAAWGKEEVDAARRIAGKRERQRNWESFYRTHTEAYHLAKHHSLA